MADWIATGFTGLAEVQEYNYKGNETALFPDREQLPPSAQSPSNFFGSSGPNAPGRAPNSLLPRAATPLFAQGSEGVRACVLPYLL